MEADLKPGAQAADPNLEPQEHSGSNLPTVRSAMTLGAVAGDVSTSDMKVPYLAIAYGVGKLAETFNPGDLILGKEHFLVKRDEPLTVVILSAVKHFKERLSNADYQNGLRPRSFLTEDEVRKNGGVLEWRDGDNGARVAPTFGPAMDMKLLIQKPKALDEGPFGLTIDGELYTPAYFSVDKSGYNRVAREVLTASGLSLRGAGLLAGIWHLSTTVEKINGNNTVVPKIKLVARTTDAFRKEVSALFAATGG